MANPSEFAEQLNQAWNSSAWRDVHVLLTVSGGADSVAMLRAMAELKEAVAGKGKLLVAHYDHRCREVASQHDAGWVQQLASDLGLECCIKASELSGERSEGDLRHERREFFLTSAARFGARYVVTAHTADDLAETVLFRVLRGTGLAGVQGIVPLAPLTADCSLVRPLLGVTRNEIFRYLQSLGQSYREDASNLSTDPTRNWIRHELLPSVATRFDDAPAALRRLASHATQAHQLIVALASKALASAIRGTKDNEVRLIGKVLADEPPLVVREALRMVWRQMAWPEQEMNASKWERLSELASLENAPEEHLPGGIRVEMRQGDFFLRHPTDRKNTDG